MAATIKIKNSSTTGAVPTSGDLVQGELAVNVTDTGLYTENASGTVVKLNAPSIDDKNTGATKHLTISTGGNLGLGVTPSAWSSSGNFQIKGSGLDGGIASANQYLVIGANGYYNAGWKYITTGSATLYQQSAGQHQWYSAGSGSAGGAISYTQAMTLDASGNLGLGTTSPTSYGSSYAVFEVAGSTSGVINVKTGSTIVGQISNGTNIFKLDAVGASTSLGFFTNTTERARIDSSGNLLVGTTSLRGRLTVDYPGSTVTGLDLKDTDNASGSYFSVFRNSSGTLIGSITRVTTTNAVAFNTTSDERLKSNIEDASPVLEKLMQVQVRQYDWTEGDLHQDYGFIAQELEPVLSGVVTKGKTEEDIWQLDYSRLTPHLVKAIQEQQTLIQDQLALINSLTARVEALENK